jgi:hypothetical protein
MKEWADRCIPWFWFGLVILLIRLYISELRGFRF